jgi:hypothetical protein
MPDNVRIQDTITVNDLPGSPNGLVRPAPGITVPLKANPYSEYVAGGVGGSGQWYTNWARTLPYAIDDVTTDFGTDLYERMLVDAHVASVFNVLKSSILEDGIRVLPAVDDESADGYQQAADMADVAARMLDDLTPDLDTVLWNLLDACALGNRVAEQVYRMDSTYAGTQQVTLEALRVKPRSMYAFVVDAYLRLLGLVGLIPGVGAPLMQGYLLDPKDTPNLLPRDKFLVYSFRPVQQDPRGTSVLRPAYTPWNLKQQIIREHVRYLTQFAAPSLVGYTPENAQSVPQEDPLGNPLLDSNGNALLNPTPEQAMQQALAAFRNGSVVALPGGSKLDVLFSTGEGGAFHAALDRYDRDITEAVLSQTLATSEGQHQARAASEVHQDVQDTIIRQAKRAVERVLRRDVLRAWVRYNYGEQALPLTPKVTLGKAEAPDLPTLWTAAAALQTSGYLAPSQLQPLDEVLNLQAREADELPPTPQEQAEQQQAQLQMQLDAKAQQPEEKGPAA